MSKDYFETLLYDTSVSFLLRDFSVFSSVEIWKQVLLMKDVSALMFTIYYVS